MIRPILTAACLALTLVGAAPAQPSPDHLIVAPGAILWGPAPPSLPPGARSALLYGDPAKPELFVMRLRFPKGYRVAPHIHPLPEVVTVISGRGLLGFGRKADGAQTHRLTPGTFMVTPANAPHYARFEEDTVLQLSTTGPWSITYVDPADDPRNARR